jgi:hypothetical protein
MTEFFKFILSDFWIFVGFCLILSGIGNFIFRIYNRTLRHYNVKKHGYPPAHCDADGDFKPTKKDED